MISVKKCRPLKISNIPGFIAPTVVGLLLDDYGNRSQWQVMSSENNNNLLDSDLNNRAMILFVKQTGSVLDQRHCPCDRLASISLQRYYTPLSNTSAYKS